MAARKSNLAVVVTRLEEPREGIRAPSEALTETEV
jgi:hypothetical protein